MEMLDQRGPLAHHLKKNDPYSSYRIQAVLDNLAF